MYRSFLRMLMLAGICFPVIAEAQVTPATNIIGIDITMPENASYTYDSAFIDSYVVGMRQVGLHFLWKSSIEPTPGIYDLSYLDIANLYYPYFNVAVDLNIDPIETNVLELPTDLAAYDFDDPIVINRFKNLLDSVFEHIPDLQLSSLVIGSEVDGYLGTDAVKWAKYTTFYAAVSAYAKTKRPGLKVACEAMYPGLTGASSTYLQTLNAYSDYIGVSYYPLNGDFTVQPAGNVAAAFEAVVNLYPSTPIYYYQLGYPSSSFCSSSELQQAEFITAVFENWDVYAGNIQMIDFTWLHDWSQASVNYWSTYYGISDNAFLGFLGSIGLRNWGGSGTDKLAFTELKCQALQRGFNNLNINCTTGISKDNYNNEFISVFPDPAQTAFTVEFPGGNFMLEIFDLAGRKVCAEKCMTNRTEINCSGFSNGIYFVKAIGNDRIEEQKIMIAK